MKKMFFLSILISTGFCITHFAYSHNFHSSSFEDEMEEQVSSYLPEISINSNDTVAIVNSKGIGLILKNLVSGESHSLYENHYINPKIIWTKDSQLFTTIIQEISSNERVIVVVDLFGTEIFRQTIELKSIDYGWISIGTQQGLFLNSSNNIIFPYRDNLSSVSSNNKRSVLEEYSFIYDGKNDTIEIIKNGKKIREIKGRIYDISLSPLGNYLSYGINGGFTLYFFQEDKFFSIPTGTDFTWSPDESKIAYQITRDNGHYTTSSELFIYNLIDKTQVQITDTLDKLESSPYWKDNETLIHSYIDSDDIQVLKTGDNSNE